MTLSSNLFTAVAVASLASFASAQYTSSTIANAFNDISPAGSGAGVDTGIVADDEGVNVPIGFSFNYFGSSITSIDVSSNGFLSDGGANLADFSPECLGTATDPMGRISPFQDDYSPNIAGVVYSATEGAAGNQTFTVQWDGVPSFVGGGGDSSFTFQATLFEADNSIEFHYGTLDPGATQMALVDGSEQVIGIESQDGATAFEISCLTAIAGGNGYRFELPAIFPPLHTAPATGCIGSSITMSGIGEPFHFYGIAVSGGAGPSPFLPGCDVDLGLDYLANIIGLGIINAAGATADHSVFIPPTLACGSVGYSQMITLTLGPIANVQKSPQVATTVASCQIFTGDLDMDALTSDHYEFTGTAGDVVTISMCRLESAPGSGCSVLDPRVCIFDDAPVFAGLGLASGDDNLGDCYFPGCPDGNNYFSAGSIVDFVIPATGTYTIAASGWGATMGPYELTVAGCTGTVTAVADEAIGGCF